MLVTKALLYLVNKISLQTNPNKSCIDENDVIAQKRFKDYDFRCRVRTEFIRTLEKSK